MDLQLGNKNALITGASQGIGRATAKALAAEGVQTAIAARRGELLNNVADDIAAVGHLRPIVIAHDIMANDGAESLGEKAIEALGTIDILINSAGGSRKVDLYADAATVVRTSRRNTRVKSTLPCQQKPRFMHGPKVYRTKFRSTG